MREASSALRRRRFDRALALFEQLSRLEPASGSHWLRIGDCLVRLGRTARAVAAYCEAARRLEGAGREPQALAVWRIARRLDPEDPEAFAGLLAAERAAAPRADSSADTVPPMPCPAEAGELALELEPVEISLDSPESLPLLAAPDATHDELVHKQSLADPAPRSDSLFREREERIHALEAELAEARRFALLRAIEADLSRARRFDLPLVVLAFASPQGDLGAHREAAMARLRVSDSLGVLPGGRIVVSALGCSARGARTLAEKLIAVLPPGAAAGVACLVPDSELSGGELLALAFAALERGLHEGHRVSTASASWSALLPDGSFAQPAA